MSRQPKSTAISAVRSHARHHGSRTTKFHARPAIKASNNGPCSKAYQHPQCISHDSMQLSAHQAAGAEQLAASSSRKVPKLDLPCVPSSDRLAQAGQQRELQEPQRALQEYHEAQHEADHAQQEHPEAHVAQRTFLPGSPHTARSSQSDATHLDHHDSYRSDSTCPDACQAVQAALDADPHSEVHQQQSSVQQHPPAADAGLLTGDRNVFQHEMSSHRYDDISRS